MKRWLVGAVMSALLVAGSSQVMLVPAGDGYAKAFWSASRAQQELLVAGFRYGVDGMSQALAQWRDTYGTGLQGEARKSLDVLVALGWWAWNKEDAESFIMMIGVPEGTMPWQLSVVHELAIKTKTFMKEKPNGR